MEWIKTAADETREVFALSERVEGEQAKDEDGNPVGDIPVHHIPVAGLEIDEALAEVKKFVKDKHVNYVQVGKTGVAVRVEKEGE